MSIEFYKRTDYDAEKILKSHRDVVFYIDNISVVNDNRFKIYLQYEPGELYDVIYKVKDCWQIFDLILTNDDTILKSCPNAIFFHIQTASWIDKEDYMNIDISLKRCKISNITGFKRMCKQHLFRHYIYFNQKAFNNNLFTFFRSSAQPILPEITNNPIIGSSLASKIDLFKTFQFSLVIENTTANNAYSEKLIDCIITKTIPIYSGCKNIHEYFDTTGWIIIENNSIDEIIAKCSIIDENYYNKYIDIIEKNYNIALSRIDYYERLNKILEKVPGYIN